MSERQGYKQLGAWMIIIAQIYCKKMEAKSKSSESELHFELQL